MFQSLEYWTERGIRAPKLADSVWVRSGFAQAINLYWKSEYAKAAEEMREGLSRNEIALSEQSPAFSFLYGTNQALAGDLSGAVATLEAATKRASEVLTFFTSEQFQLNPGQALAWAYIQSGMSDKARRLLETQERWFLDYRGSVEIVDSRTLYEAALNARLMNDSELALERLQQAVSAGWREYYIKRNDPRWGALSDDGRFQALMAKVKADVDRQRAEVERIEAEEDFPALLDKVREKQQATAE
jgi:hypothetical protein